MCYNRFTPAAEAMYGPDFDQDAALEIELGPVPEPEDEDPTDGPPRIPHRFGKVPVAQDETDKLPF